MKFWEIMVVATGLSMDACAVSICQGLSLKKISLKPVTIIALFFGVFQFAMTILGYFLSMQFAKYIVFFDHWVAFILLFITGLKIILDSFEEKKSANNLSAKKSIDLKLLLVLAIATSIDALAVGISFVVFNISIFMVAGIIGIITFILCFFGVFIGNFFGVKFKRLAEICGGTILILMGIKILLEHFNILSF